MMGRNDILLAGAALVVAFAATYGVPFWVLSQKAAMVFHVLGLVSGGLGAGALLWAYATGREGSSPRNPANGLVLVLVVGLAGFGLGYGTLRYVVPPVAILLAGASGETPVLIQTNGDGDTGSRRGCRAKMPVAEDDPFRGQWVCVWTQEFKRELQEASRATAMVGLEGRATSWGVLYWRTKLIQPDPPKTYALPSNPAAALAPAPGMRISKVSLTTV